MPKELPPISAELVEALKERFPLRNTPINVSDREIWAEHGRQDLLAFLEFQLQQQQKNVLKDSHVLRQNS